MLDTTRTLLDFADKAHLLPLVLLFFFLGLLDAITMAAKCGFRCMAEVVNYYFEFRVQCANSKAHFEQTSIKGRPS